MLPLALFVGAILLLFPILLWIQPWRKALSFYELEDEEQDQYMELANKIDALLLANYLKTLPAKIVLAFFTFGIGLMLSSLAYSYRRQRNAEAKRAARKYVEELRRAYERARIDWNTFPGSQSVIGWWGLPNPNLRVTCPVCKKTMLQRFHLNGRREILCCRHCHKTLIVERSGSTGRPEQLLIPGLYTAAIPLSGDIDDLNSLVEVVGSVADLSDLFDFL